MWAMRQRNHFRSDVLIVPTDRMPLVFRPMSAIFPGITHQATVPIPDEQSILFLKVGRNYDVIR